MASYNIRTIVNNAKSPTSPPSQNVSKTKSNSFLVRVLSINLDPDIGLDKIGSITGEKITSLGNPSNVILSNIKPISSYNKIFPLVNEVVQVQVTLTPNSNQKQFVYGPPLSFYGAASTNNNISLPPTPSNPNNRFFSKKQDYTKINEGEYEIANGYSQEPSTSQPPNLIYNTPSTFIEKGNIHPLLPFGGDVIYEGRWGQSLRFSSTAKVNSKYKNQWSNTGDAGNPIIILRNGQNPNSSFNGAEPITENITNDLSSIYLTSYQTIPFSIQKEDFNSYSNIKPECPAEYQDPQIILNSNRIILNAKKDSVLISGENSINLSSNQSLNFEANQVYVDSKDIKLGAAGGDQLQAVLLGDITVDYLKIIIKEIKNLSTALKSSKTYIGGTPATDGAMLLVASTAETNLSNVLQKIDSIKSFYVKTI